MKKFKSLGLILLAVALLASCGSPIPKGQTKVELPCFQDKYSSDKKDYIASGLGTSSDEATARKKAMITAKSEIASLIKSNIKSLVDDYTVSRNVGNKEELKTRFEAITTESVDQILTDIQVACQELTMTKRTKEYNSYVALKINKDQLATSIVGRLSEMDRKELDMDYERFRQMLDKSVANNE